MKLIGSPFHEKWSYSVKPEDATTIVHPQFPHVCLRHNDVRGAEKFCKQKAGNSHQSRRQVAEYCLLWSDEDQEMKGGSLR